MSNYKTITIASPPTPAPAASASATNSYISRSNGTQACAACKYQRRKCAPDCILAPYFPHHRQTQFLNAHKLFGVSNITKIIRYLDQPDKDQAMRTIIYQSDVRSNDPVGGCYRIIRDLQRQIEYSRAELQMVLHQLAICRAQNQSHHHHHHHMLLALDDQPGNINNNNHDCGSNMMGSFDGINNYDDLQPPPQQDNEYHPHHQLQQNCLLQNDDEVHLHEINSWAAMQNSMLTTDLDQVKQSCAADECQEDVKPLLDHVRAGDDHIIQEFKFEFEDDKTMDSSQSS